MKRWRPTALCAAMAVLVLAPVGASGVGPAGPNPVTNGTAGSLVGPAPVIRDIRAARRGDATAVTLVGTARLIASSIDEPADAPRRLVVDLPNVTSAVPGITTIGLGPVERVRIGLHPRAPAGTQVTLDLSRQAAYHVESSPAGHDLTIVFDQAVPDPIAALALPAPPPVQAPPLRQAASPASASASVPAPRFTGHPISLDFQDADLVAVLRTFGEISGLNLMIDPGVRGSVTTQLRDVPWDHALDMILRTNRLGYSVDGTIVRVAPLNVLASEEEERRKLSEAQALAGELQVMTRTLSYARATDLTTLLAQTVLSQRGSVQTDPRTNTIIINDLPDRLRQAEQLLGTLDRPEPQVEIEARIVQTTRSFARQLGLQWGFAGSRGDVSVQGGLDRSGTIPGNAVNLGAGGANNAVAVSLSNPFDLDVALSALEKQGQGRILSTPRVSTQNNVQAEITQGFQIPIQTVSNNTVTVQFRDAALTLLVTPQITEANTVIMQITVENATPDFGNLVNNIPPIDTQRAVTRVLVGDGETTVIGGIYVSREQATQDRTPGLHRIPLLGWLFKRDTLDDQSRELLIFITPRVIRM